MTEITVPGDWVAMWCYHFTMAATTERFDLRIGPADPRVRAPDGAIRALIRFLMGTQVANPVEELRGEGWVEIYFVPGAFAHQAIQKGGWDEATQGPVFLEGVVRQGKTPAEEEQPLHFCLELRGCAKSEVYAEYLGRLKEALAFRLSYTVSPHEGIPPRPEPSEDETDEAGGTETEASTRVGAVGTSVEEL